MENRAKRNKKTHQNIQFKSLRSNRNKSKPKYTLG